MLVRKRTAHSQQAAATHRGQILHFQPVLVELESAVQFAQAIGQIFERERAVLEIDASLEIGVEQRPVSLHLEGRQSAGGQIGVESFCQLEVDGAAGGKIELPGALERKIALHMQIGIFASHVQGIEMNAAAGQGGMQSAVALELNAGDGERQVAELRLTPKLIEMREWAVDRNCAGQRRLAIEFRAVRHAQQRAEIEAREFELGVGRIVVSESGMPVEGESGLLELRGGAVFDGRAGGMRGGLEGSEELPAEGERGQRGVALKARIFQRAGTGNGKREFAGGVEIAAADEVEAGDVDVFGTRVHLKARGFEVIGS